MSRVSADNGDTVRVDGKVVILPKIGRVAMVEHLRFEGSIREVTVNRTAGTWFACFCVEDGQAPVGESWSDHWRTSGWGPWRSLSEPEASGRRAETAAACRQGDARSRNVHGG